MPLAGTLAWTVIAIAGAMLPMHQAVWVPYIATGCIAYVGIGLSKLTGEDFLDKSKPKNAFDALFFHCMGASLLSFGIAIPFVLVDGTALPLGVVAMYPVSIPVLELRWRRARMAALSPQP